MSAEKRRNILYLFAGLVVVLLAVIAFVSPRFRSEDASGAIGAVQKHRAPQITQADVVLGDEQFRTEQKMMYGDTLADAAKLQNMAADIALAARQGDVQSKLALAQKALAARQSELSARYLSAATELATALNVKLDLAATNKELSAREMAEMNARLGPLTGFDAKSLASIEADVAAMEARLAANKAGLNLASEAAELASLDARYAAVQQRLNLQSRYATLNALWGQTKIVASEEAALANLMSRNLAANDRALLASSDEIAMALGNEAAALESAAVQAMNARLVANEDEIVNLGKSVAHLDSIRQMAQSRNTANAQALHDFDVAALAARANLQGRVTNLQSHQAMVMNFQLAAIRNMVDSRSQAAQRYAALNNQALASKLNNAQSLNAVWSHLASLNQRSANLASAMPDSAAYANNVKLVMDRAANLQQRNAQ